MGDRRALITGITGQDGSYLAERLLSKDYVVYGMIRQSSVGANLANLQVCQRSWPDHLFLLQGDITDGAAVEMAVTESKPHEVYNLAAQSFVGDSWRVAHYTQQVNFIGFLNLLEACRRHVPDAHIYQASSSEMYGNEGAAVSDRANGFDEDSSMRPRSPYGVSKLAAHRMASVYRDSYEMFVVCGICFNHESPRRGPMFVTRKIAKAAAEIKHGMRQTLRLGSVTAMRDWGYAPDYVRGMHMMLTEQDEPRDFVMATGESHTVAEFCTAAFEALGIESEWNKLSRYVKTRDPALMRPAEIDMLKGNASRIGDELDWKPRVNFKMLVEIMTSTEEAKIVGRKEK